MDHNITHGRWKWHLLKCKAVSKSIIKLNRLTLLAVFPVPVWYRGTGMLKDLAEMNLWDGTLLIWIGLICQPKIQDEKDWKIKVEKIDVYFVKP